MGERADHVDQISLNSSKGEEGSRRGRGREVERGKRREMKWKEGEGREDTCLAHGQCVFNFQHPHEVP